MIDLHVHSTFSDGSMTPEEILQIAEQEGITAIALTDHDTTSGLDRFLAAATERKIKAVPGIEISADGAKSSIHILGYFIDHKEPIFSNKLEKIRNTRITRNAEMIEKLNKLGIDITMADIREFAGEDVVGRLHFALALIKKGVVKTKDEAFDKFLGNGKPIYTSREKLTCNDAVRMIADNGGLPVLAHPVLLQLSDPDLDKLVEGMVKSGLQGLEVYYPEHPAHLVKKYEKLAEKYKLARTGGSDFHGAPMPDIKLGRGFGNLNIPETILEALESRKRFN